MKSRWNFSNEHTRYNPLDPKLMFWCVSYYWGAFRTVWLRNKTQCKTGQTGEKLRAMKSHRNFFATNTPNSPHWILNSCVWSVFYYLGAFATVWLPYKTRCKTSRTSAKVYATKLHWNFSQRTHPIHHIGPLTHVLESFVPFGCVWDRLVALRNSVQNGPNQCKSLCHEVALEFFATKAPVHPIGP